MVAHQQVRHFMHNVYSRQCANCSEFKIDPDAASFITAAAHFGFHLFDAPVSYLHT